jgi:hypothetical protein
VYCLDSSALIDAWVRKYPPDFLPSLWKGIEDFITNGTLVSPEEVLLELERGGDDLYITSGLIITLPSFVPRPQ